MPSSLRIAAFLPTILFIGLAGCAATQGAADGQPSAAEQQGQTVSGDDPCRKPKKERSYVEPCATMTSRDPNTPIRDIPGSVQIINRDVIDDQRALTIGEALRNVSGIQGGR